MRTHFRRAEVAPSPNARGALGAHRAQVTRAWIARQHSWLQVEWLPPYTPECNPVEYLRVHLKGGHSASLCALDLAELRAHLRRRVHRVRTRTDLAWSFLEHSGFRPLITSLREDQQERVQGTREPPSRVFPPSEPEVSRASRIGEGPD